MSDNCPQNCALCMRDDCEEKDTNDVDETEEHHD